MITPETQDKLVSMLERMFEAIGTKEDRAPAMGALVEFIRRTIPREELVKALGLESGA